MRLTGSSYRILSRSCVVFLLLPVHLRLSSFSLAVIVLYYIAFNISIGRVNNIAFDILLILYIAFNRLLEYNIATLERWAQIFERP